jgi:hypothetical protein
VGGVGAVRVTPAVIQPGRVGRGVTGGVLYGREALPAVEQHRDERVPEAVGVHPVDLTVRGAEQPGAAGELDQQPADGLLGVGDARSRRAGSRLLPTYWGESGFAPKRNATKYRARTRCD